MLAVTFYLDDDEADVATMRVKEKNNHDANHLQSQSSGTKLLISTPTARGPPRTPTIALNKQVMLT